MIKTSWILCLLLTPCFALANFADQVRYFQDLFGNPSGNTVISQSASYNQGETRPKAILKGALYIGGSDRRRETLSSGFLQMLCEDGFSKVYSIYESVNKNVSCSGNGFSYTKIGQASGSPSRGDRVYKLLEEVYQVIQGGGNQGAIFLHCHYGVHASNTIAQMALIQFCGISKAQAKSNWDVIDLYDSLGDKGRRRQFEKIDNFQPYSEFQISPAQQAAVCY